MDIKGRVIVRSITFLLYIRVYIRIACQEHCVTKARTERILMLERHAGHIRRDKPTLPDVIGWAVNNNENTAALTSINRVPLLASVVYNN